MILARNEVDYRMPVRLSRHHRSGGLVRHHRQQELRPELCDPTDRRSKSPGFVPKAAASWSASITRGKSIPVPRRLALGAGAALCHNEETCVLLSFVPCSSPVHHRKCKVCSIPFRHVQASSNEEVVSGLKEALRVGTERSVQQGERDGRILERCADPHPLPARSDQGEEHPLRPGLEQTRSRISNTPEQGRRSKRRRRPCPCSLMRSRA